MLSYWPTIFRISFLAASAFSSSPVMVIQEPHLRQLLELVAPPFLLRLRCGWFGSRGRRRISRPFVRPLLLLLLLEEVVRLLLRQLDEVVGHLLLAQVGNQ